MARNRTKYQYVTIALARDSDLFKKLQRESSASGTSLPKLIPVKLNELYSGIGPPPAYGEAPVNDVEANVLAFLDGE